MFKPWGHLTSPYVTSLFGWDFFCLVSDIFILYVWTFYLHICMCVYYLSFWCPWARRWHSIPWNWSYSGCQPHMSSGTQTWSIATGASALKHRTISPPQCYMRWSLMNFECDSDPTRFELSTSIIVILACVSTAYDAHNDKTFKEFPNKNPHFKWCVVVSSCAFVCLFVAMWNVKTPSSDSNWQSNL